MDKAGLVGSLYGYVIFFVFSISFLMGYGSRILIDKINEKEKKNER